MILYGYNFLVLYVAKYDNIYKKINPIIEKRDSKNFAEILGKIKLGN
jgi:hypothetical protein